MAEGQSTRSTGGVEGGGTVDSSTTPPVNKWENRPKVTICQNERLNRNVLEINLDIDVKAGKIEKDSLAKLFTRMGMKTGELEGFQIKRRKVFAWLLEGTDLGRFITDQSFQIAPGMKTSVIKPMDKREVQVLISGININTPDSFVISYLAFFGKLSSHKVIYDKEKDGPLAGVKNGDRRLLMDFTSGKGMGTYHLIDGESVTVSYSGQRRTCGRCHRDARTCPGGGWARACEEKGTSRLELRVHMRKLWSEIGFKPDNYELGDGEVVEEDVENEAKSFTPPAKTPVSEEAKELFSAVQVSNLPDKVDKEDLMNMLKEHGLPKDMDGHVTLRKHGRKGRTMAAEIGPLSANICNIMIANIDRKVISLWPDKLLHCVGVTCVSPVKPAAPKSRLPSSAPPQTVTSPSKRPPPLSSSSPPAPAPPAPAPPSPSTPRAPQAPTILSQATAPTPSLPLLAKTLPGVSIQAVPISARSTKAERRKADKEKRAAKLKPICVKTPGAPVSGSSGDEDSSDNDESEDEKVAEEKKKTEKKKLFRSNSSVSVKEFAGAFNELSKKHKRSPQQSEGRRVRNKGESLTS